MYATDHFTSPAAPARVRSVMRIARLNPETQREELYEPQLGDVVRLRDETTDVSLADEDKGDELGSFRILAYSGAPVERFWGKMVIDLGGISHERQTTLLLEHDDREPIGVITKHKKTEGGLELSGHFLSRAASEAAHRVRMQAREQAPGKPGIKLKSSIGVRFTKFRFLEKGDEPCEVNGKTYKYSDKNDTLVVEKCHLFENSVIYVNPADLNTTTEVMRHGNGERSMGDHVNKPGESTTGTGASGAIVPAPAPITFSTLSEVDQKRVLVEAKNRLETRDREFRAALANEPAEWLEVVIASDKTLEQAKLEAFDRVQAERAKAASEQGTRNRVADRLAAQSGRDSLGFDGSGTRADARTEVELAPEYEEAQRVAEDRLMNLPLAAKVFGRSALEKLTRAVKYELRPQARVGGEQGEMLRDASDFEIRRLAEFLWSSTPRDKREAIDRFMGQVGAKLAGGGHAGIDLAVITVQGFLDSYHESMMNELAWGVELMFTVDDPSPAGVLRWLDYWPQLQVYNEKPEERNIPVRQIQWTTEDYDATVPFDLQDFLLQKYDKINKAIGQAGAVHKRHWNKLAAQTLEANKTGYDGSLLFATSHNLGNKAPAAQSNDLSVGNGNAFCGVVDVANVSPAQLNTVLFNAAAFLLGYQTSDAEPLNEEANRKVLVVSPVKFGPVCDAAVHSARLDGFQGGAGGSRDNPLKIAAEQQGDTWRVHTTQRLGSASGHTNDNMIYMALVGNDRKPLIRHEPIALRMYAAMEGSEMHRTKNQIGFWGRTKRTVIPGAWSSIVRITVSS